MPTSRLCFFAHFCSVSAANENKSLSISGLASKIGQSSLGMVNVMYWCSKSGMTSSWVDIHCSVDFVPQELQASIRSMHVICQRLKVWVCFHSTFSHALPLLKRSFVALGINSSGVWKRRLRLEYWTTCCRVGGGKWIRYGKDSALWMIRVSMI